MKSEKEKKTRVGVNPWHFRTFTSLSSTTNHKRGFFVVLYTCVSLILHSSPFFYASGTCRWVTEGCRCRWRVWHLFQNQVILLFKISEASLQFLSPRPCVLPDLHLGEGNEIIPPFPSTPTYPPSPSSRRWEGRRRKEREKTWNFYIKPREEEIRERLRIKILII